MEYQYIVIDESEDEEEEQQLRTVAHVSRFENQYTISNIVASVSRRLEERRRRNVVGNRKPSVSIFKLPSSLTGINYKCTQPEMVSIGPYHHGKDHPLEFEEYKWFFLDKFLDRTRSEKDLHDHLLEMLRIEARTNKKVLLSKCIDAE